MSNILLEKFQFYFILFHIFFLLILFVKYLSKKAKISTLSLGKMLCEDDDQQQMIKCLARVWTNNLSCCGTFLQFTSHIWMIHVAEHFANHFCVGCRIIMIEILAKFWLILNLITYLLKDFVKIYFNRKIEKKIK